MLNDALQRAPKGSPEKTVDKAGASNKARKKASLAGITCRDAGCLTKRQCQASKVDQAARACDAGEDPKLAWLHGSRPHSSLDGKTPDQAYFTSLPLRLAA
jgi:hypothetical protein